MPNRIFSIAISRIVTATALLALHAGGVGLAAKAQAKTAGLPPAIRAQMNGASAKFNGAQADLKQEIFTKVIHDTETQTGQIYVIRKGGTTEMGMWMLAPDAAAGSTPATIYQFKGGILRELTTGTSTVDQISITGKNQTTVETMMTLGFGGSGTDLEKAWTITDQGSEQMSEGGKNVQVEKLDLVSNNADVRNTYSHITIWLDPIRDVSLKQVSFTASGGNTRTVYYSNISLKPPTNISSFAIQCGKKKCTVVNH